MKSIVSLFFPASFINFRKDWKAAWQDVSFRWQSVITLVILLIIAAAIPHFFRYVQAKQGYPINDFVLNMLQVRDMSLFIFLLIYSVLLLAIINLVSNPQVLLKTLQAYCLLMLLRIVCMYFVPLEAEKAILPLQDPIIGLIIYAGTPITKDLFFSGHVSTMFLLFLVIPYRKLKYCFLLATMLVAVFILMQHVHYTVDVLMAPVFAWISYRIVFARKFS